MNYILTKPQAKKLLKVYEDNNGEVFPDIESDAVSLQKELQTMYNQVVEEMPDDKRGKKYYVDVHFGMKMYHFLSEQSWFNMRMAEKIDFWRYVAVCLIPDLVFKRWDNYDPIRYYENFNRIWPSQIWWYIYLTWTGSEEDTIKMLENSKFSTDTIMNLVDRSGRFGVNTDTTRFLMKYYSQIPNNQQKSFEDKHGDLFRAVMRLNTARLQVIEPDLFDGGCEGYVRSLFNDLGIY